MTTYMEALDPQAFSMNLKISDAKKSGDYQLAYELQQAYDKYVSEQRAKNQLVTSNPSVSEGVDIKKILMIGGGALGLLTLIYFITKKK